MAERAAAWPAVRAILLEGVKANLARAQAAASASAPPAAGGQPADPA
jgi:hypothetical protein